jgi:hypothetical protein
VALTLELHLAIAFELLHRFDMAEKNTSLSMEVFDLIEFLVAQVASLSSFLAVEVACEAIIAESSTLPPVACKAMDLQSVIIISLATPPMPSHRLFLRWHARPWIYSPSSSSR